MYRRFLLLAGLCLLLGVATRAFGQSQRAVPWITREGAVAMLVESRPEWKAQLDAVRADVPPLPIYDDTDPDEWYIPYLEVAFREGLIEATDFHRDFRPGQLLTQGEAVTLAVRYKADGDESKLPQEEPDHPLSIPLHVQAGEGMGLDFPEPFEPWNVIRRADWHALARSAGVPNPEGIAVVIPPKTVPQAPSLPVTGPVDPAIVDQPVYPQQNQPGYVAPATTGYKPEPAPAYQQPTYVANPPGARPVTSGQQPSYVANPPGSRPVSSDDPTGPTSGPVVSQPTSRPANSTSQPSNPQPVATNTFTISIPSLGINNLRVTHPANVATQQGLLAPLQTGLGHLFSYPGQGGTTLVYGHSSSYSWDVSEFTKIFRTINKLNPGDRISINYGGKTYNYEVTHKQTVDASDMSAYQSTGSEKLILYTCWPPDDVKQRYLVHAKPV